MSIWNDIGSMAWGDDPLGPQFEGDRAEALRRIAHRHAAAREEARLHAMAWELLYVVLSGQRVVFHCRDEHQAKNLIERAVEISGGRLSAVDANAYVQWSDGRLSGRVAAPLIVDDPVAPSATVDVEREEQA